MNVDRIIEFLNKTEGRDKFCKAIVYSSRLIIALQLSGNE